MTRIPLLEPDEIERLREARLGRVHARQRLGIEREHESQAFGQGLTFFHLENLPVSHAVIASTTGVAAAYERTDCWCMVVALAERDGETQTGYSFRVGRALDELDWEGVADEAIERGTRMLGAVKPPTMKVPVLLDAFAGASFLGVLSGALSAEAVQKGRSLFAELVGQQVGSDAFTLVDDGLPGPVEQRMAACSADALHRTT